jgi:hypothetical protein
VLRFIDELIAAGAVSITRPSCPRCQRTVALSKQLDGQRVCRNCFARERAVPCTRCGSVREPATRDVGGGPLCPNCLVSAPVNLEDCSACGRRGRVAVRTAAGPLCQRCRHRPVTARGICNKTAQCEISRANGQPWRDAYQNRWARCSGCLVIAPVRGGTRDAPLCAKCLNPDPGRRRPHAGYLHPARPRRPAHQPRPARPATQADRHPLRPRPVLFVLAAEIPAAILARMLGIHVSVAVAWQRAFAGDWTAYAADVSRRAPHQER